MATAALADRAIVVGVGRYPTLGPKSTPRDLKGPQVDAGEMADWLHRNGAHVTKITSSGDGDQQWDVEDLRPEFSDVERPLNKLVRDAEALRDEGRPVALGRRLTIYMAGHGFAPSHKHLALITAEASSGLTFSLQATAWVDWFSDQTHFDEIVCWMDCCTIADFAQTSRVPIGAPRHRRAHGMAKLLTIYAAPPDQFAYERPDENGVVRGVFTRELLKALNGAAADEDGQVTTSSLKSYFQGSGLTGTAASTESSAERPKPYFRDDDEIVLAEIVLAEGELDRISIHSGLPEGTAMKIQRDGKATVFDGIAGPDGVIQIPLTTGIYALRAGPVTKLFEIGAGSTSDVRL
ncbi:MAG: caspase family protein [Sphingomonadaceae bacterium]|nr:caspase family protein [Sphingomonadaceae bacterium]